MKLILTRHGETEENIAGILQGHLPGKLSAEGIKQAKKLALRLKNEKLDFIYSSDLARAADTAKEIAKYHPKTSIEFVKSLREVHFGELEGKSTTEFGWDKGRFTESRNGEPVKEVCKRAKNFLQKILNKHQSDTVLFVCHGGIAIALIAAITNDSIESVNFLDNTSLSTFEINENKNHKIRYYNCIKHLK